MDINYLQSFLNSENIKLYLQDSCSLGMAIFFCFSLYYYTKYNDAYWMKFSWIICVIYAIYDLYNGATIDFWIHHISQIILCLIVIIWNTESDNLMNYIFTVVSVELSSVFLSLRSLIRTYLKQNKNKDTTIIKILKQFQPINEMIFFVLFFYIRLYVFNKDVVFNSEFYSNVSSYFNFYMIDKILFLSVAILAIINLYWGILLSNKLITKFIGYDITTYKPDTTDPFLKRIDEIKNSIKNV